jgi:Protein of unknown function (DUF3793)
MATSRRNIGIKERNTGFFPNDRFSGPRPEWQNISRCFPDDQDCLASFLALEAAEVLLGTKPANLVNVANRFRPCGRNLYQLWKKHGADLLLESGIEAMEMIDRGSSVLLLLYCPNQLRDLLACKSVAVILQKAGYSSPSNAEQTLLELQSRLATERFPHEIGIFLGYPLKDVVGFMGWARISFTCQGPWKIFGDPSESLRLAESHRQCRYMMSCQLASGGNPHYSLKAQAEIVRNVNDGRAPFLVPGN